MSASRSLWSAPCPCGKSVARAAVCRSLGGLGERSKALRTLRNSTPPSALQRTRGASKTQGARGTSAGGAGSLPACSPFRRPATATATAPFHSGSPCSLSHFCPLLLCPLISSPL